MYYADTRARTWPLPRGIENNIMQTRVLFIGRGTTVVQLKFNSINMDMVLKTITTCEHRQGTK